MLSQALQDGRVGQPTCLTHGLESVARAALLHRVDQGGHDPRSAAAQWVAERDAPPWTLTLDRSTPVSAAHERTTGGKGLVDLEQIYVRDRQSRTGQDLLRSRDDRGEHVEWIVAGNCEAVQSCLRG